MTNVIGKTSIIDVTAENVDDAGMYCIKNKKSPGYHKKIAWFKSEINKGLKIKIIADEHGKQLGFIEFLPSELAWRPINIKNYYFIQCIVVFAKDVRKQQLATKLLAQCEMEARQNNKSGICTMTSDGPWIANKTLFTKNGFELADQLGRFELLHKTFLTESPAPKLNDWTKQQNKYLGWNLIYADQCPWHEKSVADIKTSATNNGVQLNVIKIFKPQEAQNGPSGFGTYALIRDGELLADHYISKTRFENILKKENC